jgi:putative flippase GtrA
MPSRKVNAGVLAGALSIILVWAIKQYGGTELPGPVASAITTVMTFVTSYFVPEE